MESNDQVGGTKRAGLQMGANRKVYLPAKECWRFLTSTQGVELWIEKKEIADGVARMDRL